MSDLVQVQNAEHLTAMIKAIVPRSFVKTFDGLSTDEVVAGFRFCTKGLTQAELNTGLNKITEMGYCPDPAMFAKWCKGIDGFDSSNAIADSYIGKNGALSKLRAWLNNPKAPITTAIKMAYDETYLEWRSDNTTRAERAFLDTYDFIVKDFVAKGVYCENYVPPIAIEYKETAQEHKPLSKGLSLQILSQIAKKLPKQELVA